MKKVNVNKMDSARTLAVEVNKIIDWINQRKSEGAEEPVNEITEADIGKPVQILLIFIPGTQIATISEFHGGIGYIKSVIKDVIEVVGVSTGGRCTRYTFLAASLLLLNIKGGKKMKTRKILSFKEENELYVCQMQYKEGTTGVAYLTKGEFLRAKLEEKLEGIDPSLVDELNEVISLTIEENQWLESED